MALLSSYSQYVNIYIFAWSALRMKQWVVILNPVYINQFDDLQFKQCMFFVSYLIHFIYFTLFHTVFQQLHVTLV